MGLRLNRLLVADSRWQAPGPGQYTRASYPHQGDTIAIGCPLCSTVATLDERTHMIRDGRVMPAWKCTAAGCAFHDWLELESFGEDVLG